MRKYARTIATDEKSIAELKQEEKDKEKVILYSFTEQESVICIP